ncbi:hypothetical protein [Nostoc sp. CALU 1950]|uniref:hypothetical protein n=1 Tax=Nostoc sp. CALU 1950 TaxID=3104321 RepID=UPI003EB9E95A
MEIVERKDPINHYKDAINRYEDAINRRLYKRLIIVETAIHRVSCVNRTVLGYEGD